jgi:CubicO group peptidase (beta-lactamase class C family)
MKNRFINIGLVTLGLSALAFSGTFYIKEFQSLGNDFNPQIPASTSLRLSNVFSESPDFYQFDSQMEAFIKKWNIAGASVAISKNERLVFAKAYGYADRELKISTEPYNLFRVASVSKLITSVGIMKLVEQGKIKLDSRVFGDSGILNDSIYLNYIDPQVEQITVKQLLEHSAGWTSRWGDHMFMPTVIAKKSNKPLPVSVDDIIEFALNHRLHFVPGSQSSYSNLGYAVLGKVIEKVSGTDYESYIRKEVLFPLGIFDMRIGGSFISERFENEVKYYEPDTTVLIEDYRGTGQMVSRTYGGNDIRTLGAAGGWIASSTDLMKLMLAIDGNDKIKDILDPETIHTMVTPENPQKSPLGWRRVRENAWIRTGNKYWLKFNVV